ncbi:hypothetical protein P3T76_005732 [Phytophthora citrophthora]|uniref:Uncharacterized protein n=1 Tax=Phytophthora citrophthora TaxID=4793 RepID=A0AAD9GR82_9STRA|nr:hypothetical protein P3T76_005732 [Phytophthora citrophthora]
MARVQEAVATDGELDVKMSVLEKFMMVRGLKSASKARVKGSRLTVEALSKTYTKRRTGKKADAQQAALREPPDVFSDSVDAYVPRKRAQQLLNLHQDEKEVNEVFQKETRALTYERQVLDKVVCDREENYYEYEEKLWQLMLKVQGLQEVEETVEVNNQDRTSGDGGQ